MVVKSFTFESQGSLNENGKNEIGVLLWDKKDEKRLALVKHLKNFDLSSHQITSYGITSFKGKTTRRDCLEKELARFIAQSGEWNTNELQ